ncbi:MAG: CoA synthetase [Betaproteobacteria bacterium]|jgi:glutaconate CoA-transferase subunit A|nr:CoA synthetase [Pseudomonadota bacterium]NBO03050.1 CoA synthetase [Betaproteobacteria bacterium]NBO96343.1 CoA synthetase [Betaproteobacteria bacterium]NBP34008.1 CoA synthetase [Betaproteobacteria bacterium]NBP36981.1 CoA synthetase [Betaproteobacteria bacterium]
MKSLVTLISPIQDGCRLAIGKEETGASIAATLALIERGVRRLHLICLPVSGLQADLLIGAGCVETLETSAVSLGEAGPAPRFTAAVREGAIKVIDGTCPAIYAGFQASQKGIPFMPLRGILDSDLMKHRDSWKLIDNPFHPGDRIVAIESICPDVALFHAQACDPHGNVFFGRDRDGLLLAHASKTAVVTVEEQIDGDFIQDPIRAGATLPALYLDGVCVAPGGAKPLSFSARHGPDTEWLLRYAKVARSASGFGEMLDELMVLHRAAAASALSE